MIKMEETGQFKKPRLLFVLFSIWSFFLLCRPQDYLVFLGYIRPGLSLGILTLLAYLLSGSSFPRNDADQQLKLYTWLVVVMSLSIPFSYYQGASLSGLIHYGVVILFVYLFSKLMGSLSEVRGIVLLYCIGISVYSIFILTQGSISKAGRLSFGTMFDPNDIAFYLINFLTFNLIFMTRNNSLPVRMISVANVLIGVLIIFKTGSRGGLLAFMFVSGYLIFKSNVFKCSIIAKAAMVILVLISLQFMDLNLERYKTILDYKEDYNATSEEGRIAIWKTGIKLMATHPFTGVGFNNFAEGIGRDRESRGLSSAKWQTAHNSLVQIGAETGVVGFVLFLLLSLNAFKVFSTVSLQTRSLELAMLGDMAKAGFIGHFIAAMFLSQAYSVYWAFYIVLSAVLNRLPATAAEVLVPTAVRCNPVTVRGMSTTAVQTAILPR